MECVFELGCVYCNEGISFWYNLEFIMLEVYQVYGDYEMMMWLIEQLIVDVIDVLGMFYQLFWGDVVIDFIFFFVQWTYDELFKEYMGIDLGDVEGVVKYVQEIGIEMVDCYFDVIKNEVFEEKVEDVLEGFVFVIDYLVSICLLIKCKCEQLEIVECFELFVKGMEIVNVYMELNDLDLQEELFKTQLVGLFVEDSMVCMDHDFIWVLWYGMFFVGGLGVGIDCLVMLLINS